MEEVHRFPNSPVRVFDTLHWDLPRLFDDIKTAIRKGAAQGGTSTASASIPGESTSAWSGGATRCWEPRPLS